MNVTVPVRLAPELPPEEDVELLSVSTRTLSVTLAPEATTVLPDGVIVVVVGAITTVKFTGPTTLVPAQVPVVLLLGQ